MWPSRVAGCLPRGQRDGGEVEADGLRGGRLRAAVAREWPAGDGVEWSMRSPSGMGLGPSARIWRIRWRTQARR